MAMLSVVEANTHLIAFSSPAPVTATRLRLAIPVRTAATGRPSRARTSSPTRTSSRIASFSIRAATTLTTMSKATANMGALFVPFKGSPNSGISERI